MIKPGNLSNPHGLNLTFNEANEIIGYLYDDAGNLTQDNKYIYTWDQQGQLTSVKDLSNNVIASYTYNPDGLRKSKTVGSTTYNYHYDGTNLIRITNGSGATVWSFTWDNGKPVSMTNASGTTYYYVTNFRGDVIRIMDGNGTTVANYSYDPWGKILSATEDPAVTGQPIRYASYVYDTETQLYYLQARYYDPDTARFISRDPNGGDQNNPLSQNLYAWENAGYVALDALAFFIPFVPGSYALKAGRLFSKADDFLGTGLKLIDGMKLPTNKALEAADAFLGEGYRDMGNGRFLSEDGLRQVRMGDGDILGAHGGGPHMNFETLKPNPAKPGKMMVDTNMHVYLGD